jgi:hypothetical protein
MRNKHLKIWGCGITMIVLITIFMMDGWMSGTELDILLDVLEHFLK